MTDFVEAMKQERARLNAEKQEITNKIKSLKADMASLDNELKAIDAYERAKSGTTTGKRRSGIRQDVLEVIQKARDGIARADLLATMDAQGNKSRTQSIGNALQALKKAGQVTAEGGKYKAI